MTTKRTTCAGCIDGFGHFSAAVLDSAGDLTAETVLAILRAELERVTAQEECWHEDDGR